MNEYDSVRGAWSVHLNPTLSNDSRPQQAGRAQQVVVIQEWMGGVEEVER